jgi:hypothetical protein
MVLKPLAVKVGLAAVTKKALALPSKEALYLVTP